MDTGKRCEGTISASIASSFIVLLILSKFFAVSFVLLERHSHKRSIEGSLVVIR